MKALYSICVDTEVPDAFTIVCDRCAREIAVDQPLVVFHVKGFDEMQAMNPEVAKRITDRLRAAMTAPSRALILDMDNVEVETIGRELGAQLLKHAGECSVKGNS